MVVVSRRALLGAGVTAGATLAISPVVRSVSGVEYDGPSLPLDVHDVDLRQLTSRALSSATDAGAEYAEVRLTHHFRRHFASETQIIDQERITVGVRALVNGYWGFAAGPLWNTTEMLRLGVSAAAQAQENALGKPRPMQLSPRPVIQDGHWIAPIRIDPFSLNPLEIQDHIEGLRRHVMRKFRAECPWGLAVEAWFEKTDKCFAATDGFFSRQRTYLSGGRFGFKKNDISRKVDEITTTASGWELWLRDDFADLVAKKIQEIDEQRLLPVKPVDIGRFTVILDATSVAQLLSKTVGVATELDRVLGFEANASGTSYITDPGTMIDTFRLGSNQLTVIGNRSEPGGAASTNHDDEGVQPRDFSVVKQGQLTGFQTTRETASWLATSRSASDHHMVSTGCAMAGQGTHSPVAFPANLQMEASQEHGSYTDLMKTMKTGVAFEDITSLNLDMMQLNGLLRGLAFEIKNGRKTGVFMNAGILFRTPELWRSLVAVGGTGSQIRSGIGNEKGEPPQTAWHSVTASPAVFQDTSVIDFMRKA